MVASERFACEIRKPVGSVRPGENGKEIGVCTMRYLWCFGGGFMPLEVLPGTVQMDGLAIYLTAGVVLFVLVVMWR
jgi:hypothetical protein